MANKPKIRFKGFDDAWEQRKLGDVAEFSKGSGYSKGDLVEYGTPIILYGRLYTNYETRISDVDTFVDAKVGSVYSKGGEVIVPASGETAEDIARAATVDKSGILLGGDLNIVMPNKDINSSFLAISISSGNQQRELAKKAQGKSVVHIHNEEIKNLVLPFPIKDEQNKIASYFCQLDNLITLHQRKCDQMKELKKYMLKKMFPQNGAKVPEIRFDGFTDDWEQRKLGDVVTFINGRAYSQEELLSNGKYKVLRVGNFYTNDSWYYSDMELEAKYYAKEGDLLYTWSATFGPHIWHGDKVIYHYHIWKVELSDALEKHFAVQLLEKDKQSILSDKNGSTMVHITKVGMESKEVMLPPNIREQTKIGECFQNLDHLITLHQSKCENLKNLKKYMLRNMFV